MTTENVTPIHTVEKVSTSTNPFANLDALRRPQDYEEFMNGEETAAFPVRTLKEAMHLRVNPDPAYTLLGQYTVLTKDGAFFVYPQFRTALGPLPRKCNLHVAVDGHGVYFLLLIKQANPNDPEDNTWYRTAREVSVAATQGWVKVTKPDAGGWGHYPIQHKMLEVRWPTKPMEDLLCAAFPDRVVTTLNHPLITKFEQSGV